MNHHATLFVVLGLVSLLNRADATDHADATHPNFIIILADDMGYGDASCYGGWINTPNLDRLAAEGLRFTDFHSSGAVCSPTRAGLITGRYQQRAGIPGVVNADPKHPSHKWGLDPNEITFPELLQSAGYATALFGKWHLGYERRFNPMHHGFDRFRGYVSGNVDYQSRLDRMGTYDWWHGLEHAFDEGYVTHLITKRAVDFIRDNSERPFCLVVAHQAVHAPWQGPDDPPVRGKNKAKEPPQRPRKETIRLMMQELDKGVGQIVDSVNAAGIEKRTLVFFFSDNGPAGGSAGPLRGKKGSVYEGGHRVPAIAWCPDSISPGVTNELTISLDLMPTMLELADVPRPDEYRADGVSLRSLMLEQTKIDSRTLFWQHGNKYAVREGDWKAVSNGKRELFNLKSDLAESSNLADKQPEKLHKLLRSLADWKADVARD